MVVFTYAFSFYSDYSSTDASFRSIVYDEIAVLLNHRAAIVSFTNGLITDFRQNSERFADHSQLCALGLGSDRYPLSSRLHILSQATSVASEAVRPFCDDKMFEAAARMTSLLGRKQSSANLRSIP